MSPHLGQTENLCLAENVKCFDLQSLVLPKGFDIVEKAKLQFNLDTITSSMFEQSINSLD